MESLSISHNNSAIDATIQLKGSKSISNRVLTIRALAKEDFEISNLSDSEDTSCLLKMLSQDEEVFDAGHAGTSFRFMTAYLSLQEGTQTLTGSDRMKERPIGPLVDALNVLGANISYLEKEGYPPLQIDTPKKEMGGPVSIKGDISSQFISALLLIAPYLDKTLELNILGELVSRPYLKMTINLMHHFGIDVVETKNQIEVPTGQYSTKAFFVEGDWSSASYLYEVCALADNAQIKIDGLTANSLQGDAKMVEYASLMGIQTEFQDQSIVIKKNYEFTPPPILEFNLIEQPDLCQTLACMCAGLGIQAVFSGLKTLKIKETDRIEALKNELQKLGVYFVKLPAGFSKKSKDEYYMLDGKMNVAVDEVEIATYDDHRMAMAFAPLALKTKLNIENPEVVKKSYPGYWKDLKKLKFEI